MGCGVSLLLEEGSIRLTSIQSMAFINMSDQEEIEYSNNDIPFFKVDRNRRINDVERNRSITSISSMLSMRRKLNIFLVDGSQYRRRINYGPSNSSSSKIHCIDTRESSTNSFGVTDSDVEDEYGLRLPINRIRDSFPTTGSRSVQSLGDDSLTSEDKSLTSVVANRVDGKEMSILESYEYVETKRDTTTYGDLLQCVEDVRSETSSVTDDPISHKAEFDEDFRSSLNLQININDSDDFDMGKSFKLASPDERFDYDLAIAIPPSPFDLEELRLAVEPVAKVITEKCGDYPFRAADKQDVTVVEVDGIGLMIGVNGIIEKGSDPASELFRLPMSERLVVLCQLGQGASSIVYKAIDLSSMQLVALKAIQIHERGKRTQLVREVCTLYQMMKKNSKIAFLRRERSNISVASGNNHSNSVSPKMDTESDYIVDMYDAFFNPEAGVVTLMLEFMDGGSLQNVVQRGGCVHEPTLASIAVQALKGVAFLHSCSQMHRDIKPGNFLISRTGAVKVADLGIAKKMDDPGIAKLAFANRKRSRMSSKGLGGSLNQLWLSSNKMIGVFSSSRRLLNTEQRRRHSNSLSRTNTFVGTVTYMSPERLDGAEYGYSSDVWSFGLSLLALALGRFPLECIVDGNRTKGGYWTTKQLVQSAVPQLPADADFSQDFRNFLTHCMALKADDRPTCRELLQHPFLRKAAESVNQLRSSHSPGHLTQSLQELRSIILAIYTHIKQIKVDYCGSLKSWTTQQHNTLDRKVHQKIFGNVVEDSPAHILSKVLFGRTSHVLTPEHSSSNNKQAMYRRPRLHMLAKQLNLPVDVAMKGANEVYEFLRLQEDNERQEMMRRSRGEFVPQTSWGPESVSREPSSNSWVHALA